MSALTQIRAQGFSVKPVTDGLYVDPIDALTDTQRQWLIEHKPEIRRQLLDERWQWFLSLANEHGMHPHVVGAEFPTDTDKLDVIEPLEHDNERLRACMATLCDNVRVKQRQQDYNAGTWMPVEPEL